MAGHFASLVPRHIQDFTNAKQTEKHWGYAERVVPCTNDVGSCEYLDVVYGSHDLGMIYTGVIWATLLFVFSAWFLVRQMTRPSKGLSGPVEKVGGFAKAMRALAASSRRYMLPEFGRVGRAIFSRTTRMQITILAVLSGYLAIFTFIGMRYHLWITPTKAYPGQFNTRTTIGPFANRIGILAYALTPFSILLASRESILSLATGLPYQSFNFLHRWLGIIMLIQASVHTIGWTVIEVKLYNPQPMTAIMIFSEKYVIMGIVAQFLILLIFVLSLPSVIRRTGYEFFRKSHYVLAMLYIGFCWAHWSKLYVWLLSSLLLWFIDRGLRLLRTLYLHFRPTSSSPLLNPAKATFTSFPDEINGDIVRLDFSHPRATFKIGQHYYLTFPNITLWQSHPFTPLTLPSSTGATPHSYIFRAKRGETRRLALTARAQGGLLDVPVVLSGPYGTPTTDRLGADANVLCIAGGTGVTFVLPILLDLAQKPTVKDRKIKLVWAMRTGRDVEWVARELESLREMAGRAEVEVEFFVTRDVGAGMGEKKGVRVGEIDRGSESGSEGDDVSGKEKGGERVEARFEMREGRPDLQAVVGGFVEETVRGRTAVFASGPGEMLSELRAAVAGVNQGGKVWTGDSRGDVDLVCDDRLEW
ncbi:ferric reductase transmembrane component-like protein 4 [Elsinoe australis]|uniref:Ferric reductase transmembrane component-like protein 4 n=1 Tax=Elsinoe australis TaxID=40998 RepID=A0A4U7AWL7_9PEZI|nr:ferric reductase transmembrane component-like protein 4 [Elsinoe australis]